MKLLHRTMIDLSDRESKDRIGHISTYSLKNGFEYRVYYIEARYFGADKIDFDGSVVESNRTYDDYDYKIDIYFNDVDRRTKAGF